MERASPPPRALADFGARARHQFQPIVRVRPVDVGHTEILCGANARGALQPHGGKLERVPAVSCAETRTRRPSGIVRPSYLRTKSEDARS